MGEAWFNSLGEWIAIGVAVVACLKMLYANPRQKLKVWLQLVLKNAKYWVLWLWGWALWHCWLQPQALYVVTAVLALLYLYISWVEPNRLQIRHHSIVLRSDSTDSATPPLTVAVIGDIHVGIFSDPTHLNRLVSCLNRLEVDAILITGDWLYHAGSDILGSMLAFKALNKPCYSVLSESDEQQCRRIDQAYQQSDGGDYLLVNERLTHVLQILGITVLGQPTNPEIPVIHGVRLLGVSNTTPHLSARELQQSSLPTLILTHDIKQFLANSHHQQFLTDKTLVIAGQTHGGQVSVPWLTPWLVKALTGNNATDGLKHYHLNLAAHSSAPTSISSSPAISQTLHFYGWTTTGIGMTGLPFRFCCPPRIDVLTIR